MRAFFKEFIVETPVAPQRIIKKLSQMGIVPGIDLARFKFGLKGCMMIAVTEKRSKKQIDSLAYELSKIS